MAIHKHDGGVLLASDKRGVCPRRVRDGLGGVPCITRSLVMLRRSGLITLVCPSFSSTFTRKLRRGSVRGTVRIGHIRLGRRLPGCYRVDGVGVRFRRFRGATGGSVGHFVCRRTGKWSFFHVRGAEWVGAIGGPLYLFAIFSGLAGFVSLVCRRSAVFCLGAGPVPGAVGLCWVLACFFLGLCRQGDLSSSNDRACDRHVFDYSDLFHGLVVYQVHFPIHLLAINVSGDFVLFPQFRRI